MSRSLREEGNMQISEGVSKIAISELELKVYS